MNETEQVLVRRVLLVALCISALAAPASFAATPAAISPAWAVLHTGLLVGIVVALWFRWTTTRVAAAGAGLTAGVSTFIIARGMAATVATGTSPEAGLGMVILPAVVGAGGVVFLAMRSRDAVLVGLAVLVSQIVAIIMGAGDAWRAVLLAQPVVVALRFGLITVVLFGLVSAIAERRGAERDAAAAARALADARADIEHDRGAFRDRVLAEAAHELQSPLTVIKGSLELLLHNQQLAPEQRAALEAGLWRALNRLEERTQSVVRVGVEPDMVADAIGPGVKVRLAGLVERALTSCPPTLAVRVEADLPDVLVSVPPTAADHVLENLLSNADKYGPQDLPIRVYAEPGPDHVRVVVHDAGTTLQPDEAARIFEQGYRAGSTRRLAEGSGVGLSLVERLVHAWGGTVGCDVGDDGTRMWITMPLASVPSHR